LTREERIDNLNEDLVQTRDCITHEDYWNGVCEDRYNERIAEWKSRCHSRAEMLKLGPKIDEWKKDKETSDAKLKRLANDEISIQWEIWRLQREAV
jgi:hypothetical protein